MNRALVLFPLQPPALALQPLAYSFVFILSFQFILYSTYSRF